MYTDLVSVISVSLIVLYLKKKINHAQLPMNA